ncbi:hypothetical protein AAHB37_08215 [Glutamicibacter halophytocola]
MTVNPGYEQAVAAILRDNAESLVAVDAQSAAGLLEQLQSKESSAVFLHADIGQTATPSPKLGNAIIAREVVSSENKVSALLDQLFEGHYVVEELGQARSVLAEYPQAKVTTLDGTTFSSPRSSVGDAAGASLIAQQAMVEQTEAELNECQDELGVVEERIAARAPQLSVAGQQREDALSALTESDATIDELSSYLARLGQKPRSAQADKLQLIERLETSNEKLEIEQESLEEITERMELASTDQEEETIDEAAACRARRCRRRRAPAGTRSPPGVAQQRGAGLGAALADRGSSPHRGYRTQPPRSCSPPGRTAQGAGCQCEPCRTGRRTGFALH